MSESFARDFGASLRSALNLSTTPPLIPLTLTANPLRGIAWPTQQSFAYFTPPAALAGSTDVLLGPGNLWILATYFASNAPAASYVGFQLVSGAPFFHFCLASCLTFQPLTLD